MSNTDHTQNPEPLVLSNGGFEDESAQPTKTTTTKASTRKSGAELKANFMAVFGHGIGKFALISIGLVIIVFSAFAVRGFMSKPIDKQDAKMDLPNAPPSRVTIDPIDEREAERRAQTALLEANAAAKKGQTYQPDFNPAVVANQTIPPGGNAQPTLNIEQQQQSPTRPTQPPIPPAAQTATPVAVTVPAGQSSANNQQGATPQQNEQQRIQLQQAELEKQRLASEKYVEQVRTGVLSQAEELLGKGSKDGGIRGNGAYSMVSYLPRAQPTQNGTQIGATNFTPNARQGAVAASNKPVIFKAGKTIFATLDAEVNTDDGGEVFATVRGGKYDGSRLIGKIEQAPRNIRLRFNVLAPQDDRPTMPINAIAIREVDAKQGVADTIDNHTIERYSALFAGSILTGVSKAAMQPQGETVILPNGQVIVTQPPLDDKRITMLALGEVGINAGAEIRKNFSQPPTYITPANKGIGIIFLTDVTEK
jgi:intracellular multiplication protein IcmE